jgi:hypothetical protein
MSAGASKQQVDRAMRKLRKLGYKNIRVLRASNGEVAVIGDAPKPKREIDPTCVLCEYGEVHSEH